MKGEKYLVDYLFYKNGSFLKACKSYKSLFVARLVFWVKVFNRNNYEVNLYKDKHIEDDMYETIIKMHYKKV